MKNIFYKLLSEFTENKIPNLFTFCEECWKFYIRSSNKRHITFYIISNFPKSPCVAYIIEWNFNLKRRLIHHTQSVLHTSQCLMICFSFINLKPIFLIHRHNIFLDENKLNEMFSNFGTFINHFGVFYKAVTASITNQNCFYLQQKILVIKKKMKTPKNLTRYEERELSEAGEKTHNLHNQNIFKYLLSLWVSWFTQQHARFGHFLFVKLQRK